MSIDNLIFPTEPAVGVSIVPTQPCTSLPPALPPTLLSTCLSYLHPAQPPPLTLSLSYNQARQQARCPSVPHHGQILFLFKTYCFVLHASKHGSPIHILLSVAHALSLDQKSEVGWTLLGQGCDNADVLCLSELWHRGHNDL